jgi:ubiquinone biosynthesis protein COQ9
MSGIDFDSALIASFFRVVAEKGWDRASVAEAARAAALSLAEARARFPSRAAVLLRFGRQADQAALADVPADGAVRDKLFDLLMRRFDALQAHRPGVAALLRALPSDPPVALLLACATRRSMRWMLQAAGVSTAGLRGELRVRGLIAVWLWTLRAWERDDSADLSGTMAALDAAMRRAERVAGWLSGGPRAVPAESEGDASAADGDASAADAGGSAADVDGSAADLDGKPPSASPETPAA